MKNYIYYLCYYFEPLQLLHYECRPNFVEEALFSDYLNRVITIATTTAAEIKPVVIIIISQGEINYCFASYYRAKASPSVVDAKDIRFSFSITC